ncbi:hypothetical protein [Faecalibacillus intestinalis]|uniref:hypothetical protein n=1 Tax=Faecalibacillus intestinalis TaxID=1982626 RepID=UPI0022DF7C7A|nr:hypothetical protein [Faecalibacillus intestinalis]
MAKYRLWASVLFEADSKEEAMNLAQVFNKRKDCNVADNDIWDDIIAEYMRN